MILYFIRHGDPNYELNCLTPLGKLQAQALAERIPSLNVTEIYTSSYGRASETAQYSAEKLQLPLEVLDFMHEIHSGRVEITDKQKNLPYTAWIGADQIAKQGIDLLQYDWDASPIWNGNRFQGSYQYVAEGLDAFLERLGYRRENAAYRCIRKNDGNPAVFAHGGSITCAFARIFNLPAPFIAAHMDLNLTGISAIRFDGEEGDTVVPRVILINDHSHTDSLPKLSVDDKPGPRQRLN